MATNKEDDVDLGVEGVLEILWFLADAIEMANKVGVEAQVEKGANGIKNTIENASESDEIDIEQLDIPPNE